MHLYLCDVGHRITPVLGGDAFAGLALVVMCSGIRLWGDLRVLDVGQPVPRFSALVIPLGKPISHSPGHLTTPH